MFLKVKDVTVTAADVALDLAVFAAAPRLSTGFLIPGPARSPWTRFHLPGHAVCEGVCGEITNCTPHHRTSAIGEWYGIMLRMELEALHRQPEKISRPSLTHFSPLITIR